MGFYEALRNIAIFMLILNLGATLAAAMFPDFRIAVADSTGLIEELENKTTSINPESTDVVGDLKTAWDIAKFFFGNLVTGNYYLWKSLGLDTAIVITDNPSANYSTTWTFAKVFSLITLAVYALGMMEFIRGKV